jgi:hypothetical protein
LFATHALLGDSSVDKGHEKARQYRRNDEKDDVLRE